MATPSSPLGSRQPLKYEHRIKVNDFVRFLKGRKEIRTNLIEIFPGLRVEFVIKKFDEKEKKIFTLKNQQYQVDNVVVTNKQGQQVQRTAGDVLFRLEVESDGRNASGEKVKLAGEVKVDFGGKVEIIKLGDAEKDVYQGFADNKLTILDDSRAGLNSSLQFPGLSASCGQSSIPDSNNPITSDGTVSLQYLRTSNSGNQRS